MERENDRKERKRERYDAMKKRIMKNANDGQEERKLGILETCV